MDSSGYPSRRTERLRTLTVWIAVVAILLSVWALWDFWDRRHIIDEACAGFVPPGAVLDLSAAEGDVTPRPGDEGTIDLDASLPQACRFYGSERGTQFLTARVGTEPEPGTGTTYQPLDDPHARLFDRPGGGLGTSPYAPAPMGGGIDGTVTADGVTVRLPCGGGSESREVENVLASAVLNESHDEYRTADGQLLRSDREALAQIAVEAANGLAAELGCEGRLPASPERIPAPATRPVAAERADGTCAWYAGVRAAGDRLPGRVYESRTSSVASYERCLLRGGRAGDSSAWASLETFSGWPARRVVVDPYGEGESVRPATAGRAPDTSVWWASSRCGGEPAVHTLTLSPRYAKVAPRFRPLLQAYVSDIAARHGCTNLRIPPAATF